MACEKEVPEQPEAESADEKEHAEDLAITITRMGGTTLAEISLPANATFLKLKEAVLKACPIGPFAFKLITEDFSILESRPDAKLFELGISSGTNLTMITESSRDYSQIAAPEKVLKTGSYPAGLLIDKGGRLYVSHYFGDIKVYDHNFELIRDMKLPTSQPKQIVLGPSGELVIVFPKSIGVFDPDTCDLQRWIVDGDLSYSRGIVIDGDTVYASDTMTNAIYAYCFNDGVALKKYSPGLKHPCGMAVVEERSLAVADRGSNRVILLNKETMDIESELPAKDAPKAHQLRQPNDVKIDSGGNLLVMDTLHQRIAVFRSDGTFVASVLEGFFRCSGGSFCNLCCNLVTGAIAASNDDAHCITVFSPIFSEEKKPVEDEIDVESEEKKTTSDSAP